MTEVCDWSWDIASKRKVDGSIADPDEGFGNDEEVSQEEPNPYEDQNCRR